MTTETPAAWLLLPAFCAMALVMAAVWAAALRIRNAGIVDIAWSANFSLLAVLYAWLGPGSLQRRLLISAMMVVWSARLAAHLYARVSAQHPVEDGRYQELRRRWGRHAELKFLLFFQAQGFSNVLLSAPALVASLDPAPGIALREWAAAVLWSVALAGEAAADRQLRDFKRDPANRGRTCRSGLWRYSRHPNYFFEWLVWVAYFVFASSSAGGWLTLYCPLLMLYSLLRVTGIPAAEAQSLASRGDEYREYQRTTSAFVPWRPKPAATLGPN